VSVVSGSGMKLRVWDVKGGFSDLFGSPPRKCVHRVPRFELGCGPTTPGRPGYGRTGG
jgi:hypothetical protein